MEKNVSERVHLVGTRLGTAIDRIVCRPDSDSKRGTKNSGRDEGEKRKIGVKSAYPWYRSSLNDGLVSLILAQMPHPKISPHLRTTPLIPPSQSSLRRQAHG